MSVALKPSLGSPISSLIRNKRRVSALKSLGITTVREALTYYPFRVTDPIPVTSIDRITPGNTSAFVARVESARVIPMRGGRGFRLDVAVGNVDLTAERELSDTMVRLVFFSHKKSYIDWMSSRLQVGARVVVAGEAGTYMDQVQFTHPEVVVVGEPHSMGQADTHSLQKALEGVSKPQPVYRANSRISSDHIHDTILAFMRLLAGSPSQVDLLDYGSDKELDRIDPKDLGRSVPDIIPETIRSGRGLLHRAQALLNMHNPDNLKDFDEARRTLRYEEALVSQTALLQTRQETRKSLTYPCKDTGVADSSSLRSRFVASLPFRLTRGQGKVIAQIGEDLARQYPMQRLLQGEVGSGKTVVALAAMLQTVDAGHQAVLVAPTQVLAEQHYESIKAMLSAMGTEVKQEHLGESKKTRQASNVTMIDLDSKKAKGLEGGILPLVLLTGGMRLTQRRQALAVSASGRPCIVIATHAAFSKTFQAPNLALTVIDEQHRFGVEQREELRRKSKRVPHLLVMTATPIPRTAAMTWFGDLDISTLTELPSNRKPVHTHVIREEDGSRMGNMFLHIRRRIDAGERAYVVCARIDENDDSSWEDTRSRRHRDGDQSDPYNDTSDQSGSGLPPHSVAEISKRLSVLPQFAGISLATLTGRDDEKVKNAVMADFSSGKTPLLVSTTVVEVGVDVPQASCIVIFDADRFGLSQLHQLRGRVGRGGSDSWAFLVSRAPSDSSAAERLQIIQENTDGATIAQADIQLRGAGDVLGDAQSGGHSSLKLLRVVTDATMIIQARQEAEDLLKSDPGLNKQVELAGAVLDFMRGNEGFLVST